MRRKINWPDGHDFAFTIVDDTDGATLENIKPVYDYLLQKRIITTKTVWSYPPRDDIYTGQCLLDKEYASYLKFLQSKGFEMAFHNAGSGDFKRDEILSGLELFKEVFGVYPKMHINHSNNPDNIYWGADRFSFLIKKLYKLRRSSVHSEGANPDSPYFWGDFVKKNIKYIRNRTFNQTNTLLADRRLVYKEFGKDNYSNYWFSSSDGMRLSYFLNLLAKEKIDRLIKEKGCCIVYTHFAYDFVDEHGHLDDRFKETIDYISSKNGWFAPASDILDYILCDAEYNASILYEMKMDLKWTIERFQKR